MMAIQGNHCVISVLTNALQKVKNQRNLVPPFCKATPFNSLHLLQHTLMSIDIMIVIGKLLSHCYF